jgi:hypothetical protein
MIERNAFLKHFFDKVNPLNYAVMGFTASTLESFHDETLQMLIERSDVKKIFNLIEFSPYLQHVHFQEKPYGMVIHLKLSNGQPLNISLIYRFIRKGLCFMSETEVLRNSQLNAAGIKVASSSYNFEYVWLVHYLNHVSIPEHQREFFSTYDRETRTGIFAHIRGRYFLELNLLDDLYVFHRKFYAQTKDKIIRRKENKFFRQLMRKSLYVFYLVLNLVRRNQIKVHFKAANYATKSLRTTESASVF